MPDDQKTGGDGENGQVLRLHRDIEQLKGLSERMIEICDQAGLGCILAYAKPEPEEGGYHPVIAMTGDVATLCVLEKHIDASVMINVAPEQIISLFEGMLQMAEELELDGEDGDEILDPEDEEIEDEDVQVIEPDYPDAPVPEKLKDGYTPEPGTIFECECGKQPAPEHCGRSVYAKDVDGTINVFTDYTCPSCDAVIKRYVQAIATTG